MYGSIPSIIVAAGKGERMGSDIPKPLLALKDKPILWYSINILLKVKEISQIIIVSCKDQIDSINKFINDYFPEQTNINIVEGGTRRVDSVKNGISCIKNKKGLVLIHDAVRPFITEGLILSLFNAAKITGAAIPGFPLSSTLKRIKENNDGFLVDNTIPRDRIWEIQTPQVFDIGLLIEAYEGADLNSATDEACLIESLGVDVVIVKSNPANIKITYPEDLLFAQELINIKRD